MGYRANERGKLSGDFVAAGDGLVAFGAGSAQNGPGLHKQSGAKACANGRQERARTQ